MRYRLQPRTAELFKYSYVFITNEAPGGLKLMHIR